MSEVFNEFALLLLISAAAGAFATYLKQPVLIAYILVGIIAGPVVFGVVTAQSQIDLMAQVGIAVLLFMVGLKLDLHHVRHIGPVALATGLGQMAFTIAIGFGIILLMGKGVMEALYVAVALTFSSTIIIVKLLSDKRELDSLHGRIAVGFLIVQDLAVVIAMMTMSALRGSDDGNSLVIIVSLIWRVAAVVILLYLLMRYVLPKIVALMARSQELLLIFAIAWGTSLAALGEWAGFSKEAGAFLAGFSLASTVYRDAINARLTGIRDFLLLFFFIDLGAKLNFTVLGSDLWLAVVLSLFVLIGNPFIVMAIMGYMGYRKRTGFLAGLTVAQISEFSIIFIAMGISLGHVTVNALSLTTLVGLVTITLSSYMIVYSQPLYEWLAPWLGLFERRHPYREAAVEQQQQNPGHVDVIVLGLGRYGERLAMGLKEAGLSVIGVDFDPELTSSLRKQGLPVRYGDGMDAGFLENLPLAHAAWIVSTIPDLSSNRTLFQELSSLHYKGKLALVARSESDGAALQATGNVTVIYPMRDAVNFAITELVTLVQKKEIKI